MTGELFADTLHFSSTGIAFAILLDLILGEPERLPHPVVLMGRVIGLFERRFNRSDFSGRKRRFMGVVLATALPLAVFTVTAIIIGLSFRIGELFGFTVSVLLAYMTLSARGLKDAADRVKEALARGDLNGAREALSHIVGRNTAELDEQEIVRGAVETVSENTSDGVIAPIFYLLIGGVPLAMTYKAINTLDSMVGYKNERYLAFGLASARLDDIANLVPSRLTALCMLIAAVPLRLNLRNGWRIVLRDARQHPSPNAGYPEAATAGLLGIRLGGANRYSGRQETRPYMGDAEKELEAGHIDCVTSLLYMSSVFMLLLSVLVRGFVP